MQPGTISSIPGVTAAELYIIGTDTLVDTADTVVPGTADPTHYVITFSGVGAGDYRLVLKIGSMAVAIEPKVSVAANSWEVAVTGGSSTGDVVVIPVLSSIDRRAANGFIPIFVDEIASVGLSVFDEDHLPVDITGLTLELIVQDSGRQAVAAYENSELSVSDNSVSFIPKTAINSIPRKLMYSLRSLPSKAVLSTGVIEVKYAPS